MVDHFEDIAKKFRLVWQQTSGVPYEFDHELYKTNPKAVPQDWRCAVAALYIQKEYGGDIIATDVSIAGGQAIGHVYNRLADGREIDLTRDQFPEGTHIPSGEVVEKNSLLDYPVVTDRYRKILTILKNEQ